MLINNTYVKCEKYEKVTSIMLITSCYSQRDISIHATQT